MKKLFLLFCVLLLSLPVVAQDDESSEEAPELPKVRVAITRAIIDELETLRIIELPIFYDSELKLAVRAGNELGIASLDGAYVYDVNDLFNLQEGEELETLSVFTTDFVPVADISLRPGGRQAVIGLDDGRLQIWDVVSGEEVRTLEGHDGKIWEVTYSDNGNLIASASDDRTARIWDSVGTELQVLEGHTATVSSVAFSPDERRLATGSWDETAKVWNVATGEEEMALTEHVGAIWAVAFSPDGTELATGSGDRSIRIWDLETGTTRLALRTHTDRVFALRYSPDGSLLFTVSDDRTVRVWDTEDGEQITAVQFPPDIAEIGDVVFSRDGTLMITTTVEQAPEGVYLAAIVRLWGVERGTSCEVTGNGVNMRSGPGTNFDVAGSLTASDDVYGIGKTTGTDGMTWWKLSNDAWVRSDVVGGTADCSLLPEIEFEDE